MPTTRLGAYGGPRARYGSFAGKGAATGPHPVDELTRLGVSGVPRQQYGSFAGKAANDAVEPITRLGLYGGPRMRYGSFEGKAANETLPPAVEPPVVSGALATGGFAAYRRREGKAKAKELGRIHAQEMDEIMIIVSAIVEILE